MNKESTNLAGEETGVDRSADPRVTADNPRKHTTRFKGYSREFLRRQAAMFLVLSEQASREPAEREVCAKMAKEYEEASEDGRA